MTDKAHPNYTLMASCLKAFQTGDIPTLQKLMAPDITWRVPGRHPLAKVYQGQQEVFGFFQALMMQTNGTFRTHNYHILHDEEAGVFLGRLTGERPGKTLDVELVLRVRFKDGKMTEGADFIYPEDNWDDFWTNK
jgi:ketosteroid isomerase-like protein